MHERRGSIWRKWDLHVHTPESYHQNFGDDWDKYVEKLREKAIEHSVSVMGVTDYFSIAGYKKLVDEYEPKGEPEISLGNGLNLTIIPNIELRIDRFDQDGHSINLHVLFDNESLSAATIQDCFLDRLSIIYRGNKLTCKESDLIKIGYAEAKEEGYNANLDITKISESERQGLKKKALSLVTLSFDDMMIKIKEFKESLQNAGINSESYLFAIAAKGHGGLSNMPWLHNSTMGRQGSQRQHLLNHTDICFSNSEDDRIFNLGEDSRCPKDIFLKRFRTLKPCIWGSDAHDLDNLFHPSNGKTLDYTWIKSDPTFTGLKQIIYEPKNRIKIQDEKPISTLRHIDKVNLSFDEDLIIKNVEEGGEEQFCFQGTQEIFFSPNLNCIVGGRGSGKSTLLNLIHYSIKPDENNFFDNEVKILDSSKDVIDLEDCITVTHNSGNKIEFLNQNEIEKFALDNERLTNAIYQRLLNAEGGSNLKAYQSQNALYLDEVETVIEKLKESIQKEETFKDLTEDLLSNRSIISFLEDDEYEKLQLKINTLSQELSAVKTSREKLSIFLNDLKEVSNKYNSSQNVKMTSVSKNQFEKIIQKLVAGIESLYERYKVTTTRPTPLENKLESDLKASQSELSQFLKDKDIEEESIRDLASAQENVNELNIGITEVSYRLKILEDDISSFEFSKATKDNFSLHIKNLLKPVNKRLEEISEENAEIKKIELVYHYNHTKAKKEFCKELIENYLPAYDDGRIANFSSALEIIDILIDDNMIVMELKDVSDTLNEYNASPKTVELFKDFFESEKNYDLFCLLIERYSNNVKRFKSINVRYDDRAIESTSFGQRCTAAMVILLSLGNTPIVVDEPEAHLDSSLIAKYLVELIKKRKQQRQIIFATHNANFVINGDAELIHILEMDDRNNTKFKSTTIENKINREVLVNLEGGKEAFVQREKKYDFR